MELNIETIQEKYLEEAYGEIISSVYFDVHQQITGSSSVDFADVKYLISEAYYCQSLEEIQAVLENQFSYSLSGYDFQVEVFVNDDDLKFEHDEKYVKYFEVEADSSYYEKGLVMNNGISKDDILSQLNNTLEIRVDYNKRPLPF